VTLTDTAPSTGIVRPPSWRLELPAGMYLLNANQNLHFRRKAEHVKVIRNAAATLARHSKLPALQRAHVFYVVHPGLKVTRRDPGNWAPSAKAAVDGLVDAGVLPDDDSTRLLGPDPRIGAPQAKPQLVLIVTDLDAMDPANIALLNPPGEPS
jgi:hypothetical protein